MACEGFLYMESRVDVLTGSDRPWEMRKCVFGWSPHQLIKVVEQCSCNLYNSLLKEVLGHANRRRL